MTKEELIAKMAASAGITKALQETKGNQIQAAELLGLNRNTLRKKIQDLHIPVKRGRSGRVREA